MKKLIIVFIVSFIYVGLFGQCQTVVCNSNTNVSVNSQGEAFLSPMVFTSGDHSQCDLEIALYDVNNSDVVIDYQDTLFLTCDHLGDFIVRVRDKVTNNTCFGQIGVFDMQNFCTSLVQDVFGLETTYINGVLNIVHDGDDLEVSVYNVVGQRMLTQKVSSINSSIDLNVLPQKGIYIVSAMIKGQMRSEKIIVQ